jgi:AcrR family transcriptional regulator
MQAIAALITGRNGEITFSALAKASGVPERTIYRYFESKEELFNAFWKWLNERLGMPSPPTSPEELVAQVPALFAAFETDEPLVRAMLHDDQGRATRLTTITARQSKLRAALDEVVAPLSPVDRRRLLTSVQALLSAASWETMKDYCAATSTEAADAAQWAIDVLIAEARRQSRKNARARTRP